MGKGHAAAGVDGHSRPDPQKRPRPQLVLFHAQRQSRRHFSRQPEHARGLRRRQRRLHRFARVSADHIEPEIFFTLNPATELMLGVSSSFETRQGGDLAAIASAPDSLHPFVEKSQSNRLTTQVKLERKVANGHLLTLKNSVNHFQRDISIRDANFHRQQLASYSELSFLRRTRKHATVAGVNYLTDAFDEKRLQPGVLLHAAGCIIRSSSIPRFLQKVYWHIKMRRRRSSPGDSTPISKRTSMRPNCLLIIPTRRFERTMNRQASRLSSRPGTNSIYF